MIQGKWIDTEKELPPDDGTYEITNNPDYENDPIKREGTSTAYYDGLGFNYCGVYRNVRYWRRYEPMQKRYGRIK
jgi:hypothetical protein